MEKRLTDIDKSTLLTEHKELVDSYKLSKKGDKETIKLTTDFENLLKKYSIKVKTEFIEYIPIITQ
jgi:hypothetical protein